MSFDARPPVRRLTAVLCVGALALVGLVVASPGSPGSASTADEATLASLVNGARTAAGLPPLAVDGALSATARSHSAAMAAAGSLFHSGNLAGAIGDSVTGWTSIAENVAVAGSVTEAHRSLMASSAHRAHILGDFNVLGVGVVAGSDGRVWVTERFARTATATVAPAPAPASEPVPEPAPAPEPVPVATVVAAAVEPAPVVEPTPAPKPRPRRTTSRVAAAGGPAPAGDDVSCLPLQAQDHGQGHAYGRCEDFTSNGQGQRGG